MAHKFCNKSKLDKLTNKNGNFKNQDSLTRAVCYMYLSITDPLKNIQDQPWVVHELNEKYRRLLENSDASGITKTLFFVRQYNRRAHVFPRLFVNTFPNENSTSDVDKHATNIFKKHVNAIFMLLKISSVRRRKQKNTWLKVQYPG